MKEAIAEAKVAGVTHLAFGDLFLEDIRDYRVRLLQGTGVEPLFPIWTTAEDTPALARTMLAAGLGAVLDLRGPEAVGRAVRGSAFDEAYWRSCPSGSIPAANGASSTRSATGALSSARRSPSRSEKSSNGKGSGSPVSSSLEGRHSTWRPTFSRGSQNRSTVASCS